MHDILGIYGSFMAKICSRISRRKGRFRKTSIASECLVLVCLLNSTLIALLVNKAFATHTLDNNAFLECAVQKPLVAFQTLLSFEIILSLLSDIVDSSLHSRSDANHSRDQSRILADEQQIQFFTFHDWGWWGRYMQYDYWLLSTDIVPLNTNSVDYWLLSRWATIRIFHFLWFGINWLVYTVFIIDYWVLI